MVIKGLNRRNDFSLDTPRSLVMYLVKKEANMLGRCTLPVELASGGRFWRIMPFR